MVIRMVGSVCRFSLGWGRHSPLTSEGESVPPWVRSQVCKPLAGGKRKVAAHGCGKGEEGLLTLAGSQVCKAKDIPAGAVTDSFGNPNVPYSARIIHHIRRFF